MCLLQKIYCDSNSTKNVGCNNSYSNSTSLLLFELTSQLGTNRSIGPKFGTHYQHCVHQSYIFVKNVWTPDKSWEPGILKFECYWKLKNLKKLTINPIPRKVHLHSYCWTLWNNKSFHIVQNNVPSINEKSSSGPRISGTTKYVWLATFDSNKEHTKLCYIFLKSGINLWWIYRKALWQNWTAFLFSLLVYLAQW